MSNRKWRKKLKHVNILGYNGEPCPRCGLPTEIRSHKTITAKQLRQPFYYSEWYNCTNPRCKTTLIMPECFKVFPHETKPWIETEQYGSDVVLEVLNEGTTTQNEKPPWE